MNKKSGFTLMELLSVVVILSVLTSVAIPQYIKSVHRTEAANALMTLKTIYDSAKRYQSSFDSWPSSFQGLDTKLLLTTTDTSDPWYGTSGAYQYSFPANAVRACRVKAGENGSPQNLYCLQATYTFGSSSPNTYTCSSSVEKYQNMCASLCNAETLSASCTIK